MFIDLGDANLLVRITTVVVDDKYLTLGFQLAEITSASHLRH